MIDIQALTSVATTLAVILVAAIAIYFAFRIVGKLVKIVVILAILGVVAWVVFSGDGLLKNVLAQVPFTTVLWGV